MDTVWVLTIHPAIKDEYTRNMIFTKLSQWKFLRFSAECEDKGGTKDGSCASGYGVCCTCK